MFLMWPGAVSKNCGVLELVLSNALLTLLGTPHLVDGLVLLATVVLPTQPLHAVTVLLELLVTKLGLIHSVAVLCTAMGTVNLYPVPFINRCYTWFTILNGLSNQILHLIIITQ
jgi:hypothetical protein